MTKFEKQNWLCNIQNEASEVPALLDKETVQHILKKYGVRSIEDLSPCYYSEVFNELDFIATDSRD